MKEGRRDFLKGGLLALAGGNVAKLAGATETVKPKPVSKEVEKLKIANKKFPPLTKRKGWHAPVYNWEDTCCTISVGVFNPILFTT